MRRLALRRGKQLLSKGMQMEYILILVMLFIFLGLVAFLIAKRFKEAGL